MGAEREHYDSLHLSASTHALARLLRVSYLGDLSERVAGDIRDDVSAAKRAIDHYRAENADLRTALARERRRVRQLRRAVLAWAGRWAESEASTQLRFSPEICDTLLSRSDAAWSRARDRSKDEGEEQ